MSGRASSIPLVTGANWSTDVNINHEVSLSLPMAFLLRQQTSKGLSILARELRYDAGLISTPMPLVALRHTSLHPAASSEVFATLPDLRYPCHVVPMNIVR